jgi:hypothetical protein
VLPESWLTQVAWAPWPEMGGEPDDVPPDPFRRGTALCRRRQDDPGGDAVEHLAGSPNPAMRPLQLVASAADLDAIGRFAGVAGKDTFLDYGGWLPGLGRKAGDDDYLAAAFSELGAAMKPGVRWRAVEGLAHLPTTWVPQPVTPTTYCEIEWGGAYPRSSAQFGNRDFAALDASPEDVGDLDERLVLTYHYLYPARVPAAGQDGPRRLEGQWEAVSLFFACDPGPLGPDGRPTALTFREPPVSVVVSRGLDGLTKQDAHLSLHRTWSTVSRTHAHPVLYVASGTHRHWFAPEAGVTFDPSTTAPGTTVVTASTSEHPGREIWLVWSVALATAAPLIAAIVPFGPILVLLVTLLALAFLIAWLISLIWEAIDQASGAPIPDAPQVDNAAGDGPGTGGEEEPAGPAAGSAAAGGLGPAGPVPGAGNSGSSTGRDIVDFDVRVVDLLNHADEAPAWWWFTGGWGVDIPDDLAGKWDSGPRRVDEQGRSWAYWHALRLLTVMNGGSEGS